RGGNLPTRNGRFRACHSRRSPAARKVKRQDQMATRTSRRCCRRGVNDLMSLHRPERDLHTFMVKSRRPGGVNMVAVNSAPGAERAVSISQRHDFHLANTDFAARIVLLKGEESVFERLREIEIFKQLIVI